MIDILALCAFNAAYAHVIGVSRPRAGVTSGLGGLLLRLAGDGGRSAQGLHRRTPAGRESLLQRRVFVPGPAVT
ncbi:hypothetical protein [Hydrogenophaga intermedia]|uniref:hypothetical protein n=1 Tax=Hydrogenophaga intermedia TaxID=65786 RepID=UPI002043336E|nr:hypothetical protein [Hydrogenophaga intermedia]MCM3562807.1 hypothetical protein [Hydrogenophaga intermedia]